MDRGAPTTVSVPHQHRSGIDETLDEDYQMDYKSTNNKEDDEIYKNHYRYSWGIRIYSEFEYME